MKSMLKSELAREAGVSVKTLNRWCKRYEKKLNKMGWRPRMKLLPPKVVAFITETFCIDV
jgi:transposase